MNLVGAGVLLMLLGGVGALLLSPYPRAADRVFGLATGGGCAGGVAGIGEGTPATLVDPGPAARLGLLGALILLVTAAAWVLRAALFGRARRRSGATWGCAYARPGARMQYTAASFGAPILSSFVMPTGVGRARPGRPSASHAGDRIMRNVAHPAWNRIQALALAVRPLQQGRVTTYLQYMVWTVLLLLGFLFASTGSQR